MRDDDVRYECDEEKELTCILYDFCISRVGDGALQLGCTQIIQNQVRSTSIISFIYYIYYSSFSRRYPPPLSLLTSSPLAPCSIDSPAGRVRVRSPDSWGLGWLILRIVAPSNRAFYQDQGVDDNTNFSMGPDAFFPSLFFIFLISPWAVPLC